MSSEQKGFLIFVAIIVIPFFAFLLGLVAFDYMEKHSARMLSVECIKAGKDYKQEGKTIICGGQPITK